MRFVCFKGSMMWKQTAKSELKNVDITQTGKLQNGFFGHRNYFMYVFYSFRECRYFKTTKIEIKLKICIIVHCCCCNRLWCSAPLQLVEGCGHTHCTLPSLQVCTTRKCHWRHRTAANVQNVDIQTPNDHSIRQPQMFAHYEINAQNNI